MPKKPSFEFVARHLQMILCDIGRTKMHYATTRQSRYDSTHVFTEKDMRHQLEQAHDDLRRITPHSPFPKRASTPELESKTVKELKSRYNAFVDVLRDHQSEPFFSDSLKFSLLLHDLRLGFCDPSIDVLVDCAHLVGLHGLREHEYGDVEKADGMYELAKKYFDESSVSYTYDEILTKQIETILRTEDSEFNNERWVKQMSRVLFFYEESMTQHPSWGVIEAYGYACKSLYIKSGRKSEHDAKARYAFEEIIWDNKDSQIPSFVVADAQFGLAELLACEAKQENTPLSDRIPGLLREALSVIGLDGYEGRYSNEDVQMIYGNV